MGKLHSVMSRYAGPGLDVPPTWRDHPLVAEKYVPPGEAGLRQELNQIVYSLEALPLTRDNYGLIHSDFELDNLCWRSGNIGMLDFDGFSQGWYAADIAFALGDLFEAEADLTSSSFRKFVRGYSSHYPLHNDILLQIPTFLRMANLLTYGTLARTLDLPGGQEYP